MFDRFAICEAFALLEAHYNVGGWLRERPSNQRRRESIGCQLTRIGYYNPRTPGLEDTEPAVQSIYLDHVLKWRLPIDDDLRVRIRKSLVPEYIQTFNHPDLQEMP